MWTNKELAAIICGLRQLQNYGYPYDVDEELTDEEIDTLCENINFETAIPEENTKAEERNHLLWIKDLEEMLEFARAGDYFGCLRNGDLWKEVLPRHADNYPYDMSFDEYDTEWFEKNNQPFVEFVEHVIDVELTEVEGEHETHS